MTKSYEAGWPGRRRRALFGALTLAMAGIAAPAGSQDGATIAATIRADQPGPKVDVDSFGQFAEHLGTGIYGGIWVGKGSSIPNENGYRSDVLAALKAIKVPMVRW